MRTGACLAAVMGTVAAFASAAQAADSPGLALAKKAVEETRGDAHREKMRIVWPDAGDEDPPDGAEVVTIDGYISYVLTRFTWHEGRVEARWVAAARSWFYNPKGESFSAGAFDVEPAAFKAAWNAARHLAVAHDERLEPLSAVHDGSYSMSVFSHEPHRFVRIADVSGSPPRTCRPRGTRLNSDGVRLWDGIRDRATFDVFTSLCGDRASRDTPVADWRPYVTDAIRSASKAPHTDRDQDFLLALQVRVAGEAGDPGTLGACEALAKAQGYPDSWFRGEDDLGEELVVARTKLSLRCTWNSEFAARVIRENPHALHWQEDLAKWVRRRFRERDQPGYVAILVQGLEASDGNDLLDALEEIRELHPASAVAGLRRRLDDPDGEVRVDAARALLAIDAMDAAAARTLVEAVDDPSLPVRLRGSKPRRRRVDALNDAVELKILEPKDLRARLAEPQAAYFVQALLDALQRTSQPASDDELRSAWLRVLDRATEPFELLGAAQSLLDLGAIESRDSIARAIDRCAPKSREEDPPLDALVTKLRARLAKEMPLPSSPK